MPVRFDNVSEQIFRGGKPSPTDLQILSDIYNIKRIITLDGKIGAEIAPLVKSLGMEHVVIPIGGPESEPLVNFLKDSITTLLEKQPVYIHCRHGSDRTGMAIAMYRIQNDDWSPQKAIKEARRYDFGEKLNQDVENMYAGAILSKDLDSNTVHDSFESAHDDLFFNYSNKATNVPGDDIVTNMRDWFNFGDVPPAFLAQQSWGLKEDIKFAPPDELADNAPPGFRDPYYFNTDQEMPISSAERRRRLRRIIMQEMGGEDVPLVGKYDNYEGIRGGGPGIGAGDAGGFAHSDRGLVPGGVGFSETGGFLNL